MECDGTCDGNCAPVAGRDAMLVDREVLNAAIADAAQRDFESADSVIAGEPVLSVYLHGQMLQTIGKLALVGASTDVVRGVAVEIHSIVGVTAHALRRAYRALLDGVVPDIGGPPASGSGESESHEDRAGGTPTAPPACEEPPF